MDHFERIDGGRSRLKGWEGFSEGCYKSYITIIKGSKGKAD